MRVPPGMHRGKPGRKKMAGRGNRRSGPAFLRVSGAPRFPPARVPDGRALRPSSPAHAEGGLSLARVSGSGRLARGTTICPVRPFCTVRPFCPPGQSVVLLPAVLTTVILGLDPRIVGHITPLDDYAKRSPRCAHDTDPRVKPTAVRFRRCRGRRLVVVGRIGLVWAGRAGGRVCVCA